MQLNAVNVKVPIYDSQKGYINLQTSRSSIYLSWSNLSHLSQPSSRHFVQDTFRLKHDISAVGFCFEALDGPVVTQVAFGLFPHGVVRANTPRL